MLYIYNIKSCILHDDAHKHYFYLYHAIIIMIILWLFFHITTTQYLTALALVQDYRRHLAYSSPPPTPMLCKYSRPIVTACLYSSALLVAELGSCLHP